MPATLRRTTVDELSAEVSKNQPEGFVFVATAFNIEDLDDAGLKAMSLSDNHRSYLITTLPRNVAVQSKKAFFESYKDALRAIYNGEVRVVGRSIFADEVAR